MSERATQLHAKPWRGVLYITGGGSQLIAELLSTPGASRTVLEVSVPYANTALADLLGHAPAQACSAATARAMAMVAFQRAKTLAPTAENESSLFGLSCTASLATDREKRGKHRAHLAIQTDWHTHCADIELHGDRASQEQQLLDALWAFLEYALADRDADADSAVSVVTPQTSSTTRFTSTRAHASWRDVLRGDLPAVVSKAHDGQLILPGSFNPVHRGHQKMLALAEQVTGRAGAFELSIVNVDKPPLDYHEIGARLAQLQAPVWLTRLPTFAEKARQFPAAVFAVGVDTMLRVDAVRYYMNTAHRDTAIEELASLGCQFLVFGRAINNRFLQLRDLELSANLRRLCKEVPPDDFREDISSTELRSGGPS